VADSVACDILCLAIRPVAIPSRSTCPRRHRPAEAKRFKTPASLLWHPIPTRIPRCLSLHPSHSVQSDISGRHPTCMAYPAVALPLASRDANSSLHPSVLTRARYGMFPLSPPPSRIIVRVYFLISAALILR
jgi:hypothetical protein